MIATTAALIGAAVIGGGAAILSSHAQKSAANKAANVASDNTAANNALAREFYAKNTALLSPYSDMGLSAGRTLSELLLGTPAAPPSAPAYYGAPGVGGFGGGPGPTYGGGTAMTGGPLRFSPRMVNGELGADPGFGSSPAIGALGGSDMVGNMQYGAPEAYPGGVPGAVTSTAPASSAWDTFRNSTNYQFRLGEGERAINQGWAARGALESGAAAKALLRYGQDYASNELGNYMNLLSGQQNLGLNAARAVAGVGGDLVSNVTSNNNSAAEAAANAALAKGNANANMYTGIASSLTRALGALGGSSYGVAKLPT